MKTLPVLTLPALFAALLTATTPVLAQTQVAQGEQPAATHAQKGNDTYHATLDQRIAQMHQRLRITPAQEDAWNAFAQVMRDNANAVEQDYQQRASAMKTMNASQNLQDYARIEQDRAQRVQKLSAAFDSLYGQLSDEQKSTADAMFRHYEMTREQRRQARAK